MSDTIISALISIIGVLLGLYIGGRISRNASIEAVESANKNALTLMQRQEFNQADETFRAAFIKEQRLLAPNSLADKTGTTASDIIKAAIDYHEIAMIRFNPFVCKSQLDDYEKAWKDYAGDSKHFEQYSTTRHIDIPEKKKLALDRIEKLLQFAEPKH